MVFVAYGIIGLVEEVAVLKQLRLVVRRLDRIVEGVRVHEDEAGHLKAFQHLVVVLAINRGGMMHASEGK